MVSAYGGMTTHQGASLPVSRATNQRNIIDHEGAQCDYGQGDAMVLPRSKCVGGDDLTTASRPQCIPGCQTDGGFDEPDRPIEDEHVRTAGMRRARADERVDVAKGGTDRTRGLIRRHDVVIRATPAAVLERPVLTLEIPERGLGSRARADVVLRSAVGVLGDRSKPD